MARVPNIRGTDSVPAGPLAWLKDWLESVRTWVRMRDPSEATVGDALDKFTTRGDLVAWGVVTRSAGGAFSGTGSGGGNTIIVVPPGGGGGGAYVPDLTPPPTPTGLAVSAGITNVYIEFDAPAYTVGHGHAQTNVYGAIWLPGDAEPTFSDPRTKLIDTIVGPGTFHAYASNPATRWCIWIKWQSVDGVESTAPAGGTFGAQTTTGQDVGALLDILAGQITASQLANELARPILSIEAQLSEAASNLIAAFAQIVDESDGRAAAILEERVQRVTADQAEAALRTLLAAQVNDPVTGLPATRATLLTNYSTTATMNAAIADSVLTLSAQVADDIAAAVEVSANATATLDGDVRSLYTVRTVVSGAGGTVVGGFGLAGTSTAAGGATIDFGVAANRFYIAAPAGSGVASTIFPFVVQATEATVNGVLVPVGVYMDAAFIRNGTITNAKIGNAAIDDAKVANLSAAKLTVGDGTVGGDLKSTVFIPGSAGWRIRPSGAAEFNNVTVRGTVFASAGSFAGSLVAATGTFAGSLSAATGTFTGTLTVGTAARSGTTMTGTGARFDAADGTGCWGNATTNLTFDGAAMKMNGRWVTQDNLSLASFTVTAGTSGTVGATGNGVKYLGTITAVPSGGRAPYSFVWVVSSDADTSTPEKFTAYRGAGSTGPDKCDLYANSTAPALAPVTQYVLAICTVTDADGRVASNSSLTTLQWNGGTP